MTERSNPPEVSILVVTYKQHELLGRCLDRVAQAVRDLSTETIVVVNGVPLEPEHDAARARGALVLHAPLNLGMPSGLQWARSHARGRVLAVVQDDVEVDQPWLEPLLAVLDCDPTVGAVGSRVCLLDGTPWADGMVVARGGWGQPIEPAARSDAAWAVDACYFAGCVVRAAAWDAAGGPNRRLFPNQLVDLDFGLRLEEAGWSVLVARDSVVRHLRNASTTSRQRRYLSVRNRQAVVRDHHQILGGHPEPFRTHADVEARLEQLAEVARRRREAPPPPPPTAATVPLSELARDARADARRVRIGWTLFPGRVWADRVRRAVLSALHRARRVRGD